MYDLSTIVSLYFRRLSYQIFVLLGFTDLKLESWDKAIKDCNKVLSFETDNIKGESDLLSLKKCSLTFSVGNKSFVCFSL